MQMLIIGFIILVTVHTLINVGNFVGYVTGNTRNVD